MNVPALLRTILDRYTLPLDGIHGVSHWARVLENGLRLAPQTGADETVVTLFALFHDSRRCDDGFDPDHGPRAAEFAATLRGRAFDLDDHRFRLLRIACEDHTRERTHVDPTVGTCWDADRLDLGRIGVTPHPDYLSTAPARLAETISWATARASREHVPALIATDWGVNLLENENDRAR